MFFGCCTGLVLGRRPVFESVLDLPRSQGRPAAAGFAGRLRRSLTRHPIEKRFGLYRVGGESLAQRIQFGHGLGDRELVVRPRPLRVPATVDLTL